MQHIQKSKSVYKPQQKREIKHEFIARKNNNNIILRYLPYLVYIYYYVYMFFGIKSIKVKILQQNRKIEQGNTTTNALIKDNYIFACKPPE